jgi:anti-anti-sigma factor
MANVHVLPFRGEIDFSRTQWLEGELGQIEAFGPGAITILDLSDVRFADSAFLSALLRLHNRLLAEKPRNALLVVAPRETFASRLLELTKLDDVFRVFEDLPSARAAATSSRRAAPLRGASRASVAASRAGATLPFPHVRTTRTQPRACGL